MHLCYVDESGTPPTKNKASKRRYFVLAGVVMHETQWHAVSKELKALKKDRRFSINGEIKWRYFGPDNDDPSNPLAHLKWESRDEFRSELFNILTKRKSVSIIVCAADTVAAYEKDYVQTPADIYHYCYKAISERLQYHLQDLGRTVGEKQLGIVVADPRGKTQDDELRKEHHRLIDQTSPTISNYDNIIDSIFFTPSHLSEGIQFADMVAGAVGRALINKESTYARQLKPSFRRSGSGRIRGFGFVWFPDKK
jgi:hypothetical protein